MKLFDEIFSVINERLGSRRNDLGKLSFTPGDESDAAGVTWHSFEKWLVLESYFACCDHLKGNKYQIIPEPMYRWNIRPEDQEKAKSQLKNKRADLLIVPKQTADTSIPAICLEFTLVQPGDNPTTPRKLMEERQEKIGPAMSFVKTPHKWSYYQIVLMHRKNTLAKKHPRIGKLWDEFLKQEDENRLVSSGTLNFGDEILEIHALSLSLGK